MDYKCAFYVLLVFSLVVSCYLLLRREGGARPGLLVLPYDYYLEPQGVLLDLDDFRYLFNSDACSANHSLVHIVTSYAGNVEARSAIRRAYSAEELASLDVARVFLLAELPPSHQVTQSALLNENQRYGDLVQGGFLEAYRNLTYKHVMGLKWVVEHCKHAKYIIKSDDDILIDMYRLVDFIENHTFEMMGYLLNDMRPIRIKANKWYVTKEEYPNNTYPPFLSGWMYAVQVDAAKKILSHTHDFKYFWIDDLFVTGLLAQRANVTLLDAKNLFSLHPEVVECCLRKGMTCGFVAAPSGGDYSLQLKFQLHSKTCYRDPCPEMPKGVKIEDRCVAKQKLPPLRKGFPKITVIH